MIVWRHKSASFFTNVEIARIQNISLMYVVIKSKNHIKTEFYFDLFLNDRNAVQF